MDANELLAQLRAAMEDVPEDDLTRELFTKLDREVCSGRLSDDWK